MKKFLLITCLLAIVGIQNTFGQCFTAPNGQWPTTAFNPACTGVYGNIATDCFTGEYSLVNVTSGNNYTFRSTRNSNGNNAYITISNLAGTAAYVSGVSTVNWTATFTGTIRFYSHVNVACNTNAAFYTRSVLCNGVVPSAPANNNCANAFPITANVTCILTNGTSVVATQQFAPSVCSGFAGVAANDVWYTFTANGVSTYTINVTGTSSMDMVLGLYSSCAVGSLITCVDATVEDQTETLNLGILAAGTYYYRVYDYWGSTGTFNTCVVRSSPLPIELISFTANCDDNGNRKIDWITASEINNDHFIIERSFDAINWTEVHREPGAGNSNTTLSYSWTDSEILAEKVIYYRLTQFDFNGQFETFDMASVNCNSKHTTAMVWPSPNDGGFNVRFAEDAGQNVLLVISNSMGSAVFEQCVQATGSDQIVLFSLQEKLAPGIYYLTIHGKTTQTLKVMVGK